jgi:phosphotransferase system enzyme I (PtsI)
MFCETNVVVRLEEGLHARPAAQVAKLAKSYAASVEIAKGARIANAKSTVQLMLLAVKEGEAIVIRANGDDAETAVDGLAAMVAGTAGEPTGRATAPAAAPPPAPAPAGSGLRGVSASAGVALGPAFVHLPAHPEPPLFTIGPEAVQTEIAAYRAAVEQVVALLEAAIDRLDPEAPALRSEREVLIALQDLARDVELGETVERAIRGGQNAAHAVLAVGEQLAGQLAATDDAYLRARAEDMRGIARRLADMLLGVAEADLHEITEPSVLIAADLSALDFARLPSDRLLGLVTTGGSANSHVAIIARSLGIPAVVGVAAEVETLRGTRRVAIDGDVGVVHLDPDDATERAFRDRIVAAEAARRRLAAYAAIEPRTRSGKLIEVAANIGGPQDLPAALANGARGVGLFRTEFLFMRGRAVPDELTQAAIYAEVLRACAPHPVVIRTADIGGDKPLPGLGIEREDNPFLGWRGIRLCLDRHDIFKPQLRALLRAAVAGPLRVMFPMVADAGEVHAARALLGAAAAELRAEGVAVGAPEVGIMVETPAAALCAAELAPHVDFFSIGTNDLTQYVMAADRTNPRLAHLLRTDHPAVLRAIAMTCEAAAAAGIPVAVCGEAAGDPALIPTLVRLGVSELSMSAPRIPEAKQRVTELD